MKANELRIGNLTDVNLSSGLGRTIQREINADDIKRISENTGFYNYNPISLTEEWMVKFGFACGCRDSFWVYWYCGHFAISYFRAGNCFLFPYNYDPASIPAPKNKPIIKYVHDLQNLYFALTGEELILKEKP